MEISTLVFAVLGKLLSEFAGCSFLLLLASFYCSNVCIVYHGIVYHGLAYSSFDTIIDLNCFFNLKMVKREPDTFGARRW